MSALPISDELRASVERMRQRSHLNDKAKAYETGDIVTAAAIGRSNRFPRRQWASFTRYRPQRSPDRQQSYERRHRLAFSGVIPGHLAALFTVGEMACLRIVVDEVKAHGYCALWLDEIAARAGVCRKTAQRALRNARCDGLITIEERPRPGQKNLSNIVRVTSREWLAWIQRAVKCLPSHRGTFVSDHGYNFIKRGYQDKKGQAAAPDGAVEKRVGKVPAPP